MGVQAGGWLLVARTLQWFSAVAVSILLLLQPVLATVWGIAFLDEELAAIQFAGIAVVLLGVAVARPAPSATTPSRRPDRRTPHEAPTVHSVVPGTEREIVTRFCAWSVRAWTLFARGPSVFRRDATRGANRS